MTLTPETTTAMPFIFAPDVVLPSQLPTSGGQIGEYRLLIALLDDAFQCFQKYLQPKNQRERKLFEDAETWIMSKDEASGQRAEEHAAFFSFEHVCAVLSIDADSVRERLRRWRDGQQRCANINQNMCSVSEFSRRRFVKSIHLVSAPSSSHCNDGGEGGASLNSTVLVAHEDVCKR
jgi:Ni/Co efflux regulator RcnB